jgi:hypothetical protein
VADLDGGNANGHGYPLGSRPSATKRHVGDEAKLMKLALFCNTCCGGRSTAAASLF